MNPLNRDEQSEQEPGPPSAVPLNWDWNWVRHWSILFICNLLVPFFLGLGATESGGRIGMFLGIGVLWFMGLPFGYFSTRFRMSIVIGTSITACLQLVPILQMIAGIIAYSTWNAATGMDIRTSDLSGELSGFAITVLTGQILIAFSVGCVHLVRSMYRATTIPERDSDDASRSE